MNNKIIRKIGLFLLVITLLWGPFQCLAKSDIIAPELAWQKVKDGALLVDVRTREEFDQGHLPGAINYPLHNLKAKFKAYDIPVDREVVLYCRSGRRSGVGYKALTTLGYKKLYNAGGYKTLLQAMPKELK